MCQFTYWKICLEGMSNQAHRENRETVPGQIVLIGLKGAKYCMVTSLNFCVIVQCRADSQWVSTSHCNRHSCCQGSLFPGEHVKLKAGLLWNIFHGYLIPTPLDYVTRIKMQTWNFASQLCLTTLMSNKFKACKESELALTSQWSWGKHPPSCHKPTCPFLWHWDPFSAQRETDWRKGERQSGSEKLLLGEKNKAFQGFKVPAKVKFLSACCVSAAHGHDS